MDLFLILGTTQERVPGNEPGRLVHLAGHNFGRAPPGNVRPA